MRISDWSSDVCSSDLLGALEERNRDSAERIKALMFTFEDLGNLDPGGVQTLLSAADKDKLGTALKGASETLRDFFFSNMSERSEEHTSELQSLMRNSYAVFCLKNKNHSKTILTLQNSHPSITRRTE